MAQQGNVVLYQEWSSGLFQYALELDQMKNQTANVKTGGPISKMWSSKNLEKLEGNWGAENHQYKTVAKSIRTPKEQTIREDENYIIFAWGTSETTSRIFCPALDLPFKRKIWDILKNLYLNEIRFANYAR